MGGALIAKRQRLKKDLKKSKKVVDNRNSSCYYMQAVRQNSGQEKAEKRHIEN